MIEKIRPGHAMFNVLDATVTCPPVNCNHRPRCAKCGENHLSSEFQKNVLPPGCAQCNQSHIAHYRGRQKYTKFVPTPKIKTRPLRCDKYYAVEGLGSSLTINCTLDDDVKKTYVRATSRRTSKTHSYTPDTVSSAVSSSPLFLPPRM